MRCFVFQEWVTIRGSSTITSVVQGEELWLDTTPFQDLVFWTESREGTTGGGTLSLNFDTSPTRDDAFFTRMTGTNPSTTGVSVATARLLDGNLPVARWVRWRLSCSSATSTWDATFRIMVAANSPGGN